MRVPVSLSRVKPKQGDPLAPPLVVTSTYHLSGDPTGQPYTYGRNANPTWTALEAAHDAVCGAKTVAFASGLAASAAVLDFVLPRGALVAAPSDAYYALRSLIQARGYNARFVPSVAPLAFAEAAAGAAMVWVETPTNPGLDVVELRATADACKAAGALLVVDNTLATAAGQDPFAFGADIVVLSATKATSGHSDAVIGLVLARDQAIVEKLKAARTLGGAIPGSLEAWLCLRGLRTLELRMERSSASALAVAQSLTAHAVRYPGLPTHPHHAIAKRQMRHFGPVLTFDLATKDRADRFCAALEQIAEATSFGGTETTLERRARWGGDAVSPGLLRVSVGLEEPAQLIAEIHRAIAAAQADRR